MPIPIYLRQPNAVLGAAALLTLCLPMLGQTPTRDLSQVSIDDLMNIEVTSVSKKEEKLSQAAAAIFVISQEDIARSGATNIPDLLRMVPGLEVAQINASTWAISARGFNGEFANKLLVLIDGRSVYTPLFAGVTWDTQDVPLEDIARIEVIRGPGATIWGANAVNGVINIITKKAGDTAGLLVTAGGGTQRASGTAQYGGKVGGNTDYRVFAKYLNEDGLPDPMGQNTADAWHLMHGGFRIDSAASATNSLTIQGDLYIAREGAILSKITSISPPEISNVIQESNRSGGNVLSRWNHTLANGSNMSLQFYFDRYTRSGPASSELRNTMDIDFQHNMALGGRQQLVWGGGFRWSADQTVAGTDQRWSPAARTINLFNFFLQDEITMVPDKVMFTAGIKFEHNSFTGFEMEPTARLAWTPNKRNTFWTAVSDAARIPSRTDADAEFGLTVFPLADGTPAELVLVGNPHNKSERLLAAEAGYRVQVGSHTSLDLATFFNNYRNLEALQQGAPTSSSDPAPYTIIPIRLFNDMPGTTQGVEASVNWQVTDRWLLSPGYSLLQMHIHPNSAETTAATDSEGSDPRHQAQIRSHIEISHRWSWDTSAYFVGRLTLPPQPLPSYTRLDTQLSWRLGEGVDISIVGQNLLQDLHSESNFAATSVNASQISRSAYVKMTWRFF